MHNRDGVCDSGGKRGSEQIKKWPLTGRAVLRSKGLKDATCVGCFGDDWVGLVGSPPKSMDHVSSPVPIGYAVYE